MQNNINPNFPKLTDKFSGRQAAVMFVFASAVIPFAASMVYIFLLGAIGDSDWLGWVINGLLQVSFIALFVIYSKKQNVNMITAAKINKKITPRQALILVGIAVCVLYAFTPFSMLFDQLLKILGYKSPDTPLITINSWGTYLIAVFAACILPSIGEELIYRGALTSGLSDYGKKTAILMTGVCFSLMHQNPDQTMHQFLLGCLLAWVFLETGSFWAPALIHFVNNFVVCTLQFYWVYFLKMDIAEERAKEIAVPFFQRFVESLPLAAIAAAGLVALLFALKRTTKPEAPFAAQSPPAAEETEKISVFKLPFADVLSHGKQEEERKKEIEDMMRAELDKKREAGKSTEKRAAFTTLFAGLAVCLFVWLATFFGV